MAQSRIDVQAGKPTHPTIDCLPQSEIFYENCTESDNENLSVFRLFTIKYLLFDFLDSWVLIKLIVYLKINATLVLNFLHM